MTGLRRFAVRRRTAIGIAVMTVVMIFPDVLFMGASFRNSRVLRTYDLDPATVSWGPQPTERRIWDGYRDLGAAAWQLEPAHLFIHRCLTEGESPYWNPYNACGTHGPERLVSTTFSLITVATALLGAGSLALHFVLLLTFVVSLYFLFRVLTNFYGCSLTAAVAGCFVFLLNGFHTSMLGAQMVQPYLLAPVLLYALLGLAEKPTFRNWIWSLLASIPLVVETFVPTTLLITAVVFTFAFAHTVTRHTGGWRSIGRTWLLLLAAPTGAFLILAPLWFPIFESVPLATWSEYGQRPFEVARLQAALSLVTPQHFWESYGAFPHTSGEHVLSFVLHTEATRVYHFGLVALFLAAQVLVGWRRRRWFVGAAGLLIAVGLGRTFGLFPFTLIQHLPVLGVVSLQYWGALVALPVVLLVAHGVNDLSAKTIWRWPTLSLATAIAASVALLTYRLGVRPYSPAAIHLAIFLGLCVLTVALFVALSTRPAWRQTILVLLVLLMAGELVMYMNRVRPTRGEPSEAEMAYLGYLHAHLRDGERILNIGSRGVHPNWGSGLGIPQIESLDGVVLGWYAKFFSERFGKTDHFLALRPQQIGGTLVPSPPLDVEALDLLGVRYIVVTRGVSDYPEWLARRGLRRVFDGSGLEIFENVDPHPRSFAVGTLVEAPGIPSDWRLAAREVAVTTDREFLRAAAELGLRGTSTSGRRSTPGTVKITEYHHTRVVLEADLAMPAVVVLADTWHPGWQVAVDGRPAVLGMVNEVLRGVAVPAGRHRLEMTYSPRTLRPAFGVSVVLVVSLLVLGLFRGRHRPE